MKPRFPETWFWACAVTCLIVTSLRATASPARLAVIAESSEAISAADLLTAELTGHTDLQLLERSEIEKVHREQALSAGNRDFTKLGQLLGADGLLFLQVGKEGTNRFLQAQLVAVKPGVVLSEFRVAWPVPQIAEWAAWTTRHFTPLFPKLSVLTKDALPVSIVSLRAAVKSSEEQELERQLTLLLIGRLTRERELFVLERRRMDSLSDEKELRGANESAFWSGGYLIEGTIDRDGYAMERATINLRLNPPHGGTPVDLDAAGERGNPGNLVDQLAQKILLSLRRSPTATTWNPETEAERYFEEARWALKWGMTREGQMAAEAAWALGKRDQSCAESRVRAYLVTPDRTYIQQGSHMWDASVSRSHWDAQLRQLRARNAAVLVEESAENPGDKTVEVRYTTIRTPPDVRNVDSALRALTLYRQFSQRLSPDALKFDSPWCRLGLDSLLVASQVLQQFNWSPDFYRPAADKLVDLRAEARAVADWLSNLPSVRSVYFVGEGVVTYDDLHRLSEQPNIFNLKVRAGCLWQESPEDGLALYRELLVSPAFGYIHRGLWIRRDDQDFVPSLPRLVAWDAAGQSRVTNIWNNFLLELEGSSNQLWQLEARALRFADAAGAHKLGEAFTNFFEAVFAQREAFLQSNIELLYLNWRIDNLVSSKTTGGIVTPIKQTLASLYRSQYRPRLEALGKEWRGDMEQRQKEERNATAFERQKVFLEKNRVGDGREFFETFLVGFQGYSKTQALELQPLVAAYKSNLTAQAEGMTGRDAARLRMAIHQMTAVEQRLNLALNAPAAISVAQGNVRINPPPPRTIATARDAKPAESTQATTFTNVLLVRNCIQLPREQILKDANLRDEELPYAITVVGSSWSDGKLVLDVRHNSRTYFANGSANRTKALAAILNPANSSWELLPCLPESSGQSGMPEWAMDRRSGVIFRGSFYLMADRPPNGAASYMIGQNSCLRRYDFSAKRWETLPVPIQGMFELSVVGDRLFAANKECIFEITRDGQATQILASTRRRPVASALDALESLGSPRLFTGSNNELMTYADGKVWQWLNGDWHEKFTITTTAPPDPLEGVTVFRSIPSWGPHLPRNLWILRPGELEPELCLSEKAQKPAYRTSRPQSRPTAPLPPPKWKSLEGESLAAASALYYQSNLYLFVEHAEVVQDGNRNSVKERDGCHAKLACLDSRLDKPLVIALKFDLERGQPPLQAFGSSMSRSPWELQPAWMRVVNDTLYIGQLGTGIWTIPCSALKSAFDRELEKALAELQQQAAAREAQWKALLLKHDLNRNGAIDPTEKPNAITDPAYLEMEMDKIDANQNHRLDSEEMIYFDANQNKVLEISERAAIDAAQLILATRLLVLLDSDGDGFLSATEFAEWDQGEASQMSWIAGGRIPDDNGDRKVDVSELESFLKQQTRAGLRPRNLSPQERMAQIGQRAASEPVDQDLIFKTQLESYWHDPAAVTNRIPRQPPGLARPGAPREPKDSAR